MLANFLNKSKPINFVGLLVFFYLTFVGELLVQFFDTPFSLEKALNIVTFIILFVVIFFLVNFIILKHDLTYDNSYAFFFFITLTIILLPDLLETNTLILGIIYFLFLRKIYSLRSNKRVIEKVFDAGFWLGVFFILEPISILFFLLLILAIYIHKKLKINTLIIPLLGFLTPCFIYFTYLFWFDRQQEFYSLFNFKIASSIGITETKLAIPFTVVTLFTLFCFVIKSSKVFPINNTFRRSWTLILINFLLAIVFVIITPLNSYDSFMYLLFPTSLILANGIEMIKKNSFKNAIIYIFLFGSLISLILL